jgi:hypothetical protein
MQDDPVVLEKRKARIMATFVVIAACSFDVVRLWMEGNVFAAAAVRGVTIALSSSAICYFFGALIEWTCNKFNVRLFNIWIFLLLGWRGSELWQTIFNR